MVICHMCVTSQTGLLVLIVLLVCALQSNYDTVNFIQFPPKKETNYSKCIIVCTAISNIFLAEEILPLNKAPMKTETSACNFTL